MISSQAWAPDDRRLVYMNENGYVTILDLATREHKEIAFGAQPAWSPDGKSIVIVKHVLWGDRGSGNDFFLISAEPPYQQTVLFEGRRRFFGNTFYGPAVWLPDSRLLVIVYVDFWERSSRYILDRTTGHVVELPPPYRGAESWGGTINRK
jgi:Tol biopolymer transport system component